MFRVSEKAKDFATQRFVERDSGSSTVEWVLLASAATAAVIMAQDILPGSDGDRVGSFELKLNVHHPETRRPQAGPVPRPEQEP